MENNLKLITKEKFDRELIEIKYSYLNQTETIKKSIKEDILNEVI